MTTMTTDSNLDGWLTVREWPGQHSQFLRCLGFYMYLFLYLYFSDSSVQGEKITTTILVFYLHRRKKKHLSIISFDLSSEKKKLKDETHEFTFITFWNSYGLSWKKAFIMWCSSCLTYLVILDILVLYLFTWVLRWWLQNKKKKLKDAFVQIHPNHL